METAGEVFGAVMVEEETTEEERKVNPSRVCG